MFNEINSKISILLPVFNGELYVRDTIKSILDQADKNFELVICDDASNDKSWEIIKSFNDIRVRAYKNNVNMGMTKNYEKILNYSLGQWVTIIGQDDFLLENSIYKLRKYFDLDKSADIFVTPRSYFYWPGEKKRKVFSIVNRGIPLMTKHRSWLRYRLTKIGITKYIYGPQLYTGTFINRNLIEKIKKIQGGIFFVGRIPDISSSVSLLYNSTKYNRIWESISVVGTSESSIGLRIHKSINKNSEEKTKKISEFFDTSLTQVIREPGLDGKLSSFIYYFYEESIELEKAKKKYGRTKIINKLQYTVLFSNVLAEVLKAEKYKKSIQSDRVFEEVKKQNINMFIFISVSFLLIISYVLYDISRYILYFILFLVGRYKINNFQKRLVQF